MLQAVKKRKHITEIIIEKITYQKWNFIGWNVTALKNKQPTLEKWVKSEVTTSEIIPDLDALTRCLILLKYETVVCAVCSVSCAESCLKLVRHVDHTMHWITAIKKSIPVDFHVWVCFFLIFRSLMWIPA